MSDFTIPNDELDGARAKTGCTRSGPLLLPVLAADATIPPDIDAMLTAIAAAAQSGNRAARDALYGALQPKLLRSVRRCYRWSREQSAAWDLDDLEQEGFLIFTALLAKWPGDESFTAYFFSRFPYRLNDTVRRASGFRPSCPPPTTGRPRQTDPTSLDEPALTLLAALAAELPAPQADLLMLHVRDHLSFQDVARRQGCHPLTIRRHWRALLPRLWQVLSELDAP